MADAEQPCYRFFLGGHDLEMLTIRELLAAHGFGARTHDANLSWGARASAYEREIRAALGAGETPVLVELARDLPPDISGAGVMIVDHHGDAAGADRSSSLTQVFDLLGLDRARDWTRQYTLVAANDIGHIRALRALGASAREIRDIRDADRRAQGVIAQDEAEARRAITEAEQRGRLAIVRTTGRSTSAIADFLEPEYGGSGCGDLLIETPHAFHFFGDGRVVGALVAGHGGWSGGALPQRGFWGAERATPASLSPEALIAAIVRELDAVGSRENVDNEKKEDEKQ